MGRRKRSNTRIDDFVKNAREHGMTYGQAQQRETCDILRLKGFWDFKISGDYKKRGGDLFF